MGEEEFGVAGGEIGLTTRGGGERDVLGTEGGVGVEKLGLEGCERKENSLVGGRVSSCPFSNEESSSLSLSCEDSCALVTESAPAVAVEPSVATSFCESEKKLLADVVGMRDSSGASSGYSRGEGTGEGGRTEGGGRGLMGGRGPPKTGENVGPRPGNPRGGIPPL